MLTMKALCSGSQLIEMALPCQRTSDGLAERPVTSTSVGLAVFGEIEDFRFAVDEACEQRQVMGGCEWNTIVFNDIGIPFVWSMADGQLAGFENGGIVADDNRGGRDVELRLEKRRHGDRLDGGDGDFAVVHAWIDT